MSKLKRKPAASPAPAETGQSPWQELNGWRAVAALAVAVLVFYWIPLTSSQASIQWDAVDVHYSSQKYFADRLFSGELPHWTPYIFSGFPFLADIQVGAWYPLNWPFFVAGVTPGAIQLEIALHAFLACWGAFLVIGRLVENRLAALAGGIAYGFSGFFADHASHVGMFTAASLMPWLIVCLQRAMDGGAVRFTVLGGLVGGAMILAGHFQTALYSFAALGLFALAQPRRLPRAAAVLAGMGALAVALSAVQTLPGWELTQLSIRSGADYGATQDRVLTPGSLVRVVLPIGGDAVTVTAGQPDADFFLYGGLLLLPLAGLGLRRASVRVPALLLVILPVWYMLGPGAGLYRVGALLPGFHRVRAPIHFWFVVAFGLAILAAAGVAWIGARWPVLVWAILAVLAGDLFYWNSLTNIRAYARADFEQLYANKEQLARQKVVPDVPPLTRFDAPDQLTVFGPLNHPLDLRLEAAYGYNPLELSAYREYRDAMKRNPKLAAGLGVTRYLDAQAGAIRPNPGALPRAYFARRVVTASGAAESRRLLETLDPAESTIVEGAGEAVSPDGTASVAADGEQGYVVRYRTAAPGLLKLSVPYFPGWTATVDGNPCPVVRADHALMGVAVPAGERELRVRFRSNYFGRGAAVSGAALALALGVLLWRRGSPGGLSALK